MSLTIDCGEGKHEPVCRGAGDRPYLFPQLAGEPFICACPCHGAAARDDDPQEARP